MYETPYVQTLKMRVFLHHSQMCMYIHDKYTIHSNSKLLKAEYKVPISNQHELELN